MSVIKQVVELGTQWPVADPFLFTAHHWDHYPVATTDMRPDASLVGRDLGSDFSGRDGWSMYHGQTIPGFPAHPHRGFETVTVVEEGVVDHTDSAGATARYGEGDTQWLTAGGGVAHCEMFPLLNTDRPNPLHLFQIWLNLPPEDKATPADFTMLWADEIPVVEQVDDQGRRALIKVVAGAFGDTTPPAPPAASWAADPNHHVAIWHATLEPGATVHLPPADATAVRTVYVYEGSLQLEDRNFSEQGVVVDPTVELTAVAGDGRVRFMVLQGRPIGAPVVQQGPFVGNSREDIIAAFTDYKNGEFGHWTLPVTDPVHERDQGRFARYPDGTVRTPARGW